jgi:hypothetical protein
VDVVPTEDEDVLCVGGSVEDGGYRYDAGTVEEVEIARGAGIAHLHHGVGGWAHGHDRMQHQVSVRAASVADQQGSLLLLTGRMISGAIWIDGHPQAAAG